MRDFGYWEELLLTAKLRTCGGTVFWFCYRGDRERIALFLARLEDLKTAEERTSLVRPEEPFRRPRNPGLMCRRKMYS